MCVDEIIKLLIKYRKKHRYSQKKFGEKIGLHQQSIARFEKGKTDPTLKYLNKILKGMDKKIVIKNKENK